MGFSDMGAGAAYTHRLAMNVWTGHDLPPTPGTMARLILYTLNLELTRSRRVNRYKGHATFGHRFKGS
ncbi:MAG: hypothetical protein AB8B79_12390 [Granulosicoccus sp.]